ncbi:3-isopropylmalate dehydratase small subunit [Thermoproteota archaeon]
MDGKKITSIKGRAIPLGGDDIDTDRIIPARFLKTITFDELGDQAFIDDRANKDGSLKMAHPLNNPNYKNATILIAGKNFGCGSSREHAPQAIKRYGIKAVIAESFAEIFSGNCKALGLPTVTADRQDINKLLTYIEDNPGTECVLDLNSKSFVYNNKTLIIDLPEGRRKEFLSGTWDIVSVLKSNLSHIKEKEETLPY